MHKYTNTQRRKNTNTQKICEVVHQLLTDAVQSGVGLGWMAKGGKLEKIAKFSLKIRKIEPQETGSRRQKHFLLFLLLLL